MRCHDIVINSSRYLKGIALLDGLLYDEVVFTFKILWDSPRRERAIRQQAASRLFEVRAYKSLIPQVTLKMLLARTVDLSCPPKVKTILLD